MDSTDPAAVRIFLDERYQGQKDLDDRVQTTYVLETGGPEAKVAAEIALEGPISAMRYFIKSGLQEAAARDLETAAHVAAINSNISKASKYAYQAQSDAYEAAQAAALARQASAEAQQYAQQAAAYATNAANSAATAVTQADQAKASADAAAQSLATARQAAEQARTDARTAQRHAADAATSANNAAAAAATASQAAASASQSAANAGADAEAAAQAATEAVSIAANLQREEDTAANLAKAAANTTGTVSAEELAAAEAAGGPEAAEELRAAHETLGAGDITDFIIKEGGQLLLDFFGITDIINCLTKGDIGACGMVLIGVLPVGKLFKAVEALAMIGRILPKAAAFFTKRQDAIKTVEKHAANPVACALPGVAGVSAPLTSGPVIMKTGVYKTTSGTGTQPHIQRVSNNPCSMPNINPAYAKPPQGISLIGKWAEHALGISPVGKTGVKVAGMTKIRFPDLMERVDGAISGNVIEVKNVKTFKMTNQIRDLVKYAHYGDATKPLGEKVIIYKRSDTLGIDDNEEVQRLIGLGHLEFRDLPYSLDGAIGPAL